MGTSMWLDLTLKLKKECQVDVDVLPDSTVELSFPLGGGSRATILVPPDTAKRMNAELGGLLMLIPSSPRAA
ncbi:MAG: hypothetical protein ACT4PI_16360 [Actinomycetota bacterium]